MGQDKRTRLTLTTSMLKNGNILFPHKGCEDLITQLTGFGYESHDDLADAFAILIMKIQEKNDNCGSYLSEGIVKLYLYLSGLFPSLLYNPSPYK